MSVRVQLPPGCYGLKFAGNGREFNAKRGTSVVIPDEYAAAIKHSGNGRLDIISGRQPLATQAGRGRRCGDCAFVGFAWMTTCSRCDSGNVGAE